MMNSESLFVITLIASSAPVPLPLLDEHQFEGLTAFRSRRNEDGRDRFRIHIGYFTTMDAAEAVLPLLRETYPWAFIAPAPQTNLGSLDDTGIARFRIIQPAEPAASADSAPAAAPAAAPAVAPAATLTPAPVVQAKPAQRYAVQLLWSSKPIDLSTVTKLGLFEGYLLYAVETQPGGRRMYGIRLGFYDDAESARLVALYVRPTFKGVVIPVSAREIEYASRATIRLSGGGQARSSAATQGGWPRTAVSVAFANAPITDHSVQL